MKHKQATNRCVTYLREGVVSYKCYGARATGTFQIEIKENNKATYELWKKVDSESTTAAFDGFRASGWEWEWIWGMGAGISEGKHISINFGTIKNIGEDVFHVDDKIIPIKGI